MSTARLLLVVLAAVACGSDEPADVAGNYTLALTNGDNSCGFDGWTAGAITTNVPLTITQADAQVTATVGGVAGAYVELVLGARVFTGEVDGAHLDLVLYGSRSATEGNCTFTINAEVEADLDGDLLEGEIRYRPATNGNPDCAPLDGCANVQAFNGTRPPSS
jgi:hypothetical protein